MPRHRLWVAEPPALPVSIGAPSAVWAPGAAYPQKLMAFTLAAAGASVVGFRYDIPRLWGMPAVVLLGLYLFLANRRAYFAVGSEWLYWRTRPFGPGVISRQSELASVYVKTVRHRPSFRVQTSFGQKLSFQQLSRFDTVPDFPGEFARVILGSPAQISDDARGYLNKWAITPNRR